MPNTLSPPTEAAPAAPSLRGVLASLALSLLLSSLGTSIAHVALPTFAQVFSAPFQQVQWVVLAYLLAITTLVVSVGRLGDIWGRRRLLLAGIAVFTTGSVLCAAAPTLALLVAARVVQGLGAATMVALAMALVAGAVPPGKTGSAMGLLGTVSAVGTALGPSLGGLLLAGLGWQSLFWLNLPLGLLAWLLVRRYVPADPQGRTADRPRFDGLGTLLLALALSAYALAMTGGLGHGRADQAALLLAALLGGGLFVRVQMRVASPLVPLAALRDPALGASLAANLLVATVLAATFVVGPFYLSRALGLGTAAVGLVLSIGPAISILGGVVAGRLVDRGGAAAMSTVGLVLLALGAVALALLPGWWGVAGYGLAIALLTPGYQLFQAANNTAVMGGVRADQRGVVSGLLNLSRNLGLVTGTAAMGAVFAWGAGTRDIATAQPAAVAAGLQATFGVAALLVLVALATTLAERRRALHQATRQALKI